jgi:hypothetical protein
MGVQIAGDARAYPVKLLALHEAVDDVVGGRPILVTWCPLCSSALVFDRRVAGKTLTFEVAGVLYRSNEVLIDRQTRSLWSQLGEGAGSGLLRGKRLRLVPAAEQTWRAWRAAHPQTRVLSLRHDVFASSFIHPYTYFDDRGEEASDDPYFSYKLKVQLRNGHRAVRGLSGAAHVVAFETAGRSKVYPQPLLERRKVVDDAFAGVPLVVFWNDSAQTASVFSRRVAGRSLSFRWDGEGFRDTATGSRWSGSTGSAIAGPFAGTELRPLPYTLPYWFAWHWFHPDAVIAGSNGR